MSADASDGWGEQLAQWLAHGRYRDLAHLQILERAIESERPESVIDVGCGTGVLLRHCRERGIEAYGIDRSPAVVRHHAAETGLPVVMASVDDLPIRDAASSLVVCHGLVEHLASPAQGLRELLRITRPGGRALLSVPARYSLFTPLVPIWYFTGGRHRHPWLEMVGRSYGRRSFRRLLVESGWQVERIAMFKALTFLDWLRIPFSEPLGRRIEASALLRNAFGVMLCATCRRPEGA
jgi:SAM-dependent methyltransferase